MANELFGPPSQPPAGSRPSASRIRRVIAGALEPRLSPVAVRRVIDIFEREVGTPDAWQPANFARRVAMVLGILEQAEDIETWLVEAARLDDVYLPPDPLGDHPASLASGMGSRPSPDAQRAEPRFGRPSPKAMPVASPGAVVFSSLMSNFLQPALKTGSPDFLIVDLRSQPVEWGCAESNRDAVSDALASGTMSPETAERLSMPEGKAVLQRTYELLCDEFGPILTDRWLAASVRITEGLPESIQASPRDYL